MSAGWWWPTRGSRKGARRSMYTEAYRRHRRRRAFGWTLVVLGVLVGGAHVVTHLGYFQVFSSAGLQDLVMGYPMAGALVVVALILLGGRTTRKV